MESVGKTYGVASARIVSDRTGCTSGSRWCLHDALITTKPHDPHACDLARNYTDFVDRPVQSAWVDTIADSLARIPSAAMR